MKLERIISFWLIIFFNFLFLKLNAQVLIDDDLKVFDYTKPTEYTIGGITVSGTQKFDPNVIIMISGLNVGDKIIIPGEQISNAIDKLWKQGLFENIKISATNIIDNTIFLNIFITE
ncbi:MAG TPA: POTRA domain-containing protein, partial [Bacteroidales bacterium]|nr:POTRA domain-containing protein [Bacteroidales bacterium]